jgi:hypothetical protein
MSCSSVGMTIVVAEATVVIADIRTHVNQYTAEDWVFIGKLFRQNDPAGYGHSRPLLP